MPDLILKRPHLTEKSQGRQAGERPVYTFIVPAGINKAMIKKAVAALYKVTPARINVLNVPAKKLFVRGRRGVKPGFKKAIVYLKKGDKIEL